jgi:sugar (pentulose or hexulose) kinase
LVSEISSPYPGSFSSPEAWRQGFLRLIQQWPFPWRSQVAAIAVAGTSGTLLVCHDDGALLDGPAAQALAYHQSFPEQAATALALAKDGLAASASGSLARALQLMQLARLPGNGTGFRLRHQADWLMGWLLGDWRWGEEGNNLRLGWDLIGNCWCGSIGEQPWAAALPQIIPSGSCPGKVSELAAQLTGLGRECWVVAGSTDANAAALATDPQEGDGITVLGTTLVLKQFVPEPLRGPGISCHRLAGRWLVGGASNAGAGILLQFFSASDLKELSRQIDPERPTGLSLRPLAVKGERFPIDDPELAPRLEPRPISDALYLQALLEGLTEIEVAGWQRLEALGAPPVKRVISLGGGARNPQWRRMRQRALGRPVLHRADASAALGMALLARSRIGKGLAPSPPASKQKP